MKAAKKFTMARDYAVRVTDTLYSYMDEDGLWQVAINFACLASGFPPSGRVEVDVALSFCTKFELALEILRRKSYEFMDEIEPEGDEEISGDFSIIEDWLTQQHLDNVETGTSAVEDIMQKIRAVIEAATREKNFEKELNKTLFMHINFPMMHPDHASWWIQSLKWFHKALMVEGEGVQREAKKSRISFRDADHLVLHAVKHGAPMSLKSIGEYHRDAVKWRDRAAGVNHSSLPSPEVTTNGNDTIITTPDIPPRRLVMEMIENDTVIKTYHPKTSEDSGKWPHGPYDIVKAERLQTFACD